jgi:hypothetical protein
MEAISCHHHLWSCRFRFCVGLAGHALYFKADVAHEVATTVFACDVNQAATREEGEEESKDEIVTDKQIIGARCAAVGKSTARATWRRILLVGEKDSLVRR